MMEIDLVYLWVDGSDPAWMERRRAFDAGAGRSGAARTEGAPGAARAASETNTKARWTNNDELRYSLRSAERFAPWIRRVFIVTDGQTPSWLDTSNPRVKIIDQNDILPPEARPCWNSAVIEQFLHRIPGLAERFLYANDDMFFGAPVGPEFFFTADGRPIVRLKRKSCGKLRRVIKRLTGIGFGYYRRSIFRAADQVERATGVYFSAIPHHNIDAYLREDNRQASEEVLAAGVSKMLGHRTRTEGDLQRVALSFWALATGRAEPRWIKDKSESVRIGLHKPDWEGIMRRHSPSLFCLNDSQRASDDDRERVRPFLETLFPEPSAFEKRESSAFGKPEPSPFERRD